MRPERYLAFDPGSSKIGVAFGQSATGTAQGLGTVAQGKNGPDWALIDRWVKEWEPDAFIVGLPLDAEGKDTFVSKIARRLAQLLEKRYDRPVHWGDEELSTQAADRLLRSASQQNAGFSSKRRRQRDALAAELILQGYFQRQMLIQSQQ